MLDTYAGRRMFFARAKIEEKKEPPRFQILFGPRVQKPKEVELKEFESGRISTLGNF